MFAVGVMMWELLFGECPFAGCKLNIPAKKAILKLPKCIDELSENKNISDNCKDLLLKLLTPEKEKRISAVDALQHQFFSTVNVKSSLSFGNQYSNYVK